MKEHILKTHGTVWDAVASGQKRFEVRRNDRFYQSGDTVILRRMDDSMPHLYAQGDGGKFATRDLKFRIGWILQGGQYGIAADHCVFQLEPVA